tara:strand:- start:49 stop:912 length:864 start_codon:yes stop_codon:yes gene_type:complete
MKKLKFYAANAVIVMTVWSCQKGDSSESQMSELSVSESVEVVASVDEVEELIDQNIFYADSFLDFSGLTGKGDYHDRSGFFTTCSNFEVVTLENSVTVTISFDEGCTDCYGNEVSGTITLMRAKENDTYNSSITFSDLTINGYVINGAKTYTRVLENSNGNPEITGTVDITVVTDSGIITKTGNKSVEVTAGNDTDSYLDDEITITGSSTYTSADGVVISAEITTPLVKLAECKYISQGVKEFTNDGTVSVLDYGDGACDNIAIITDSDGVVIEIELRRGRKNKHHD